MASPTAPTPFAQANRQKMLDTAFVKAFKRRDYAEAEKLLTEGASINAPGDSSGRPLLFHSVDQKDLFGAEWLLERGVVRNYCTSSGYSALLFTITQRQDDMCELLLDYGCDPNVPTKGNEYKQNVSRGVPSTPPLHQACIYGNERQVQLLIDHGAHIDMLASAGGSPLWYAGANGNTGCCARLLKAGANPEGIYERWVKSYKHPRAVEPPPEVALSEIRVNRKNCLFSPASYNYVTTLECLLDGGADPRYIATRENQGLKDYAETQSEDVDSSEALATLERYEAYPVFDPKALPRLTKRDLFEPNDNGWCLLDTPATWHHLDDVTARLKETGEELTRVDLEKPNQQGKSFLQRGVECFAFPAITEALAYDEAPIRKADLLDDTNRPTPLYHTLHERRQTGAMFSRGMWIGESADTIRQAYEQLPEEVKQDVNNLHALISAASRPSEVSRTR